MLRKYGVLENGQEALIWQVLGKGWQSMNADIYIFLASEMEHKCVSTTYSL